MNEKGLAALCLRLGGGQLLNNLQESREETDAAVKKLEKEYFKNIFFLFKGEVPLLLIHSVVGPDAHAPPSPLNAYFLLNKKNEGRW